MKTIYLKGDIGFEITADKIREKVNFASTEKLRVIVNSPGGFVDEAFEIYDLFMSYKGTVEFVMMPYAASAMSSIVMAGDEITGFKNSIWMAHRVQGAMIGNADEMITQARIMQALENVIIEAYQKRIKKPKEEILEGMKNEIWMIGWEQLTENGMIDNVIDSVDDIDLEEDDKKDIQNLIAEAGKENANALLSMRVKRTINRMEGDKEKIKNQYGRIAARADIKTMIDSSTAITSSAQKQNFTPAIQPDENNLRGVNSMSKLTDFLNANPEAKAEHDALLESAKAEGKAALAQASAALDEDRKRIVKILNLGKATLTPEVAEALEKGTEPGEFAIAQMENQKNLQNNAAAKQGGFGSLVPRQTPGDQTPNAQLTDAEAKAKADAEFDAKAKANAKKAFGKEV